MVNRQFDLIRVVEQVDRKFQGVVLLEVNKQFDLIQLLEQVDRKFQMMGLFMDAIPHSALHSTYFI